MADSIIQIKNFSKSFNSHKAVDDLTLDIYDDEIFAFLGSNGSGKTTTIRCLLDIYQADSGELKIFGEKYSDVMNGKIGYLPEERGLYTRAGVNELFSYFLQLRGFGLLESESKMNEFLKRVGLFEHKDKKISQLSSGMQQKVQIGVAIIHNPEVVILDEPFKGLDPVNRQLFIEIFKEMRDNGATIMYSTHVIDEAQKMADRLAIIHNGKRKAYGEIDKVRKNFGKDNIHIEFSGTIPENKSLYTSIITNKTAEIIPNDGVSPDQILKFLINSEVSILNYKVDYPSLNDIFIKLVKSNES